jgi:hypothetical protein
MMKEQDASTHRVLPRQPQRALIEIQHRKGESLMKSTMIRILTIATLATSFSAFAAAEPKHDATSSASAAVKQDGCSSDTGKSKQKKTQTPETDQEKEFDRVLMSIYG